MKQIIIILSFCVTGFFTGNAQQKNASTLHYAKTFHLESTGGWDYLATSPVNDWLYISHGAQVNIIHKKTGDSVGVIPNTNGVHGIAFDAKNNKGFTSNGKLNTVTVFDINNNKVLAQIPVGQNPDAIFYEPFSQKIITCNGRSNNLSIIDPVTNVVTDSVPLTGKPETAVSDERGRMYVNIEDKNELTVIDTKTFRVIAHWSISPGEEPTGLAIDPVTNRLFIGCDKQLIIVNAGNGSIVAKLPIGEGCDGVAFDALAKNIYTSNGEGTLTVIKEINANKFSVVKNITTKKGARTIWLDNVTHTVYLPTADFEPMAKGQQGRPAIKPGTFQILVLEN